jgi:plasmid replication initiation protein
MKKGTGTVTRKRTMLFPNEMAEVHRFDLTANGTKLLFGLAQCIDHNEQLFPEHYFDMQKLCEFMGIEGRTDRLKVIRDAFFDIAKNPLLISTGDAKRFSAVPWLKVSYDESSSEFVKVKFDEDARPYLMKLNGYVKLRGRDYVKLTSSYATTLYPLMKTIQSKYFGNHAVSIQRLMEMTFTDDKKKNKSYHDENNGLKNFFSRVLGVKGIRGSEGLELIDSKKKNGNEYTSAIKQINEVTDIDVRCERVKEGRTTVGVRFYVESKHKQVKSKTSATPAYQSEERNLPDAQPMSEVYALAKETGKTPAEILKLSKRTVSKCGKYAIRANDEWVKNKRQGNLFEKAFED